MSISKEKERKKLGENTLERKGAQKSARKPEYEKERRGTKESIRDQKRSVEPRKH